MKILQKPFFNDQYTLFTIFFFTNFINIFRISLETNVILFEAVFIVVTISKVVTQLIKQIYLYL